MVEIIPSITISQGHVLAEQHKIPIETFIDEYYEKFETLVVVDENAYHKGKVQVRAIQDLSEEFSLWLDANPTDTEEVIDLFIAGADYIIIVDENISFNDLEKICKISSKIVLQITKFRAEYLRLGIEKIILSSSDIHIIDKIREFKCGLYVKMETNTELSVEGIKGKIIDLWQMQS